MLKPLEYISHCSIHLKSMKIFKNRQLTCWDRISGRHSSKRTTTTTEENDGREREWEQAGKKRARRIDPSGRSDSQFISSVLEELPWSVYTRQIRMCKVWKRAGNRKGFNHLNGARKGKRQCEEMKKKNTVTMTVEKCHENIKNPNERHTHTHKHISTVFEDWLLRRLCYFFLYIYFVCKRPEVKKRYLSNFLSWFFGFCVCVLLLFFFESLLFTLFSSIGWSHSSSIELMKGDLIFLYKENMRSLFSTHT